LAAGFLTILLLAALVAAEGCNRGPAVPTFKVTPVKGTVKVNGAPLADADVRYHYEGTPPTGYLGSAGKTDASGNYEIMTNDQKGVPPGRYKVTVSKWTDRKGEPLKLNPEEGMDLEQAKSSGAAVEFIPPSYSDPAQTTLQTEVPESAPGGHTFDIEIRK
jgi:hypothetical protein